MSSRELSTFELKSGAVDALHLIVKTADFGALSEELAARYASMPDFFSGDAVAIDLRRLDAAGPPLQDLVAQLVALRLSPIAVIASDAQAAWAADCGLARVADHERERRAPAGARTEAVEPPAEAAVPAETATPATSVAGSAATLIDKPLRSGQRAYAEGDLIVTALVSHGAEIIAGGNIHVYAPLRGRALAGIAGNPGARIFCTCMEPELISIAGIYRTVETALPADVQGKPAQVRLDGEKLIIEALQLR
ncbi:MAG TPA: septum site-determining protein MinC [Rhodocyclaceae bacterium]|nr:septum site-determining protein MinC [Plasticicumulans sp.]HMZ83136.1 septum site-determining protein MinC [Rhodocyclaceae bacterium]HNC61380.1 septum site-determining protein MinC [Rhodocyclaceae bacterium]